MNLSFTGLRVSSALIKRCCHTELSDPQVKKIRSLKRWFAYCMFGGTLLVGLAVRSRRRQEAVQLMHESRRMGTFGILAIYDYKGYVLAEPVLKMIKRISRFKFREDDVLLISFPKTGTTWLQEIVWLLQNDLDYEKAFSKSIDERFPYLEFPYPGLTTLSKMTGSRLIKTHVAPSLLNMSDDGETSPKILSIVRDPKDVLVSYYYFSRMNNIIGFSGSFDEFFTDFVEGRVPYGPMPKFLKEMDEMSRDVDAKKRILVLRYEDLKNDFAAQIEKLCLFLDRPLPSSEQMDRLMSHCSFNEMSCNPSVNYGHWKEFGLAKPNEAAFMRKGEVGDYKNHFSPLQEKQFEEMMRIKSEQ